MRPVRLRRPAAALIVAAASLQLVACAAQLEQLEEIAQRSGVQAVTRVVQQGLPISVDKEREIGFGIAAGVAGRYGLIEDPEVSRYLALVARGVAQQSPRSGEVPFHVGLLDTDDVNAFAAPGGYIFLTRGALRLMESESELAAVLAHEIGHIDQRHVLDEIRRSAVLQQARDESQVQGELLDQVAEAGTTLLFMGLSREDEMESDSLAVLYASATGYAPGGMLAFLQHLRAAETAGSEGLREWTATHPSTDERIRVLEPQVARETAVAAGALGADRFRTMLGRVVGR